MRREMPPETRGAPLISRAEFLKGAGMAVTALAAGLVGRPGMSSVADSQIATHTVSDMIPDDNSMAAAIHNSEILQELLEAGDVTLPAGTFYLGKSIVVENYNGTFRGAGRNSTILQTVEGFDTYSIYSIPAMFHFPSTNAVDQTSLNMSDMSLRVVNGFMRAISCYSDFFAEPPDHIMPPQVARFDACLKHLEIEGAPPNNTTLWTGIAMFGDYKGNVEIKDVHIKNPDDAGIHFGYFHDSNITIGGTHQDRCVLDGGNWSLRLVTLYPCVNSNVTLKNNEILNAWWQCLQFRCGPGGTLNIANNTLENALLTWTFDWGSNSFGPVDNATHVIENNDFIPGDQSRSELAVLYEGNLSCVIRNNKIHKAYNNGLYALGVGNFDNAVVSNNIISGAGPSGIDLRNSEGTLLQGNNVNNWTIQEGGFPYRWPATAPIHLQSETFRCTVIGSGDLHENVLDNGTENTLVGVNNMGNSTVGEDVSSAMARKEEANRLIKEEFDKQGRIFEEETNEF